MIEWLIHRADQKNPDFDGTGKERGWEAWVLRYWPSWLLPSWWTFLLDNREGIPWINLWSPITDLYEMAYWFRTRRYRSPFLFEETMPERILCRARGHAGVGWFNPNGYEPDMTCTRCGEDLG